MLSLISYQNSKKRRPSLAFLREANLAARTHTIWDWYIYRSMNGLISMVNVGKYTIHGWYGEVNVSTQDELTFFSILPPFFNTFLLGDSNSKTFQH